MDTATASLAARLLAAAPERTAAQWDAVVDSWDRSWADSDHVGDAEFSSKWDAVRLARDIAKMR